jgi:hypothetical protein
LGSSGAVVDVLWVSSDSDSDALGVDGVHGLEGVDEGIECGKNARVPRRKEVCCGRIRHMEGRKLSQQRERGEIQYSHNLDQNVGPLDFFPLATFAGLEYAIK